MSDPTAAPFDHGEREVPRPAHRRARVSDSLKMFVPLRNHDALWAYYLGIASFIPIVSFALAPVAIHFGRKGFRWAISDSDEQGLRHSIAGIVMGIAGIGLTIFLIIALLVWWKMEEGRPWLLMPDK